MSYKKSTSVPESVSLANKRTIAHDSYKVLEKISFTCVCCFRQLLNLYYVAFFEMWSYVIYLFSKESDKNNT